MAFSEYITAGRLVDRTALRGMVLALRGELREFTPPPEPTPEFVEAVQSPFKTVEDVENRLSRLERRLREENDRRAIFLMIYSRMTRAVRAGIQDGRFANPDWMRGYLQTFANYYRQAFLAFETGDLDAVPDPWRIAFGTAIDGNGLVVQDALLGINAHINYDLALSINDIGIDPNREQKYADHQKINLILARLIDAQQEALAEFYASGIDDIDSAFGQMDEELTLVSMKEGREQAWRIAVVLTDMDFTPIRAYAKWVLQMTATGGAFFILGSSLDPSLHQALRDIEKSETDLRTVLNIVDDRFEEVSDYYLP